MKLIIAGGRDYYFAASDKAKLDAIRLQVREVVCGGARGADLEGAAWAVRRKIPVKHFYPNWDKYGKRAGMLRNEQMGEYADAVALFPGGKGTQNMFEVAKRRGLQIFDFRTNTLF